MNKLYVITENETVFILADCKATGGMVKIPMTAAQFARWQGESRESIQIIFPELPAEIRETLISGLTPAEWQVTFGKKQFKKETLIEKFYYVFED